MAARDSIWKNRVVPSVPSPRTAGSGAKYRELKATSRKRMERYSSFLAFPRISVQTPASSSAAACSSQMGEGAPASVRMMPFPRSPGVFCSYGSTAFSPFC